jgi:hypothetical protein
MISAQITAKLLNLRRFPSMQLQDFVKDYQAKCDEELIQLAVAPEQLTSEARLALQGELSRRQISIAEDSGVSQGHAMTEQPNQDERLVPLALFSTTPEAEMVCELLSQNGVACVLQGGNFGALDPLPRQGGFSEIRLLVRQTELPLAQELYEAFFVSNEGALQEDEDISASADQQSAVLSTEPAASTRSGAMYFAVSPLKLVVMSTCTFGLYELCWFYRHWCRIRENEGSTISPLARAFFAPLFCYSLFTRIRNTARASNVPITLPAELLAIAWFGSTVLSRLPDPFWVLTFSSVLFLVPAQVAANKILLAVNANDDLNTKFSKWNIVAVVIGGLLLLLIFIGMFLPNN